MGAMNLQVGVPYERSIFSENPTVGGTISEVPYVRIVNPQIQKWYHNVLGGISTPAK